MLHFTCDACGDRVDEERYVVKMEVIPAAAPEMISEMDLDADHLEEVAELLAEAEMTGNAPAFDEPQWFRFDLCEHCRERFCNDPLGKETLRRLNFSKN